MRLVLNIVDRLHDQYDFFIVTRNYDSKSNPTPYSDVTLGDWNVVGNASVFYLTDNEIRRPVFTKLVVKVSPDIVFVNSTFCTPAVVFLWARWLGDFAKIPIIVSPCGSLAPACLKIKRFKKRTYLNIAKILGFYNGVIWRASSEQEKQEIELEFGGSAHVAIAPDLTPPVLIPDFSINQKPNKRPGSVRLIYFSRIEVKKNLKFLLECLKTATSGEIHLRIMGPVDDEDYWRKCVDVIKRLPGNVKVDYLGPQPQHKALQEMVDSHFFVLPTQNENFGYVFLESLSAGCPNITSDQTVWTDLAKHNAGWRIPLSDIEKWIGTIKECVEMDDAAFRKMSFCARSYAVGALNNDSSEARTELMIQSAVENCAR
jgi:glycosyltransferase involved in cell wall biosynthesis